MPKLAKKHADAVEEAKPLTGFTIAPPGKYLAKLVDVEERESAAGDAAWNVTFGSLRAVGSGEEFPGRVFYWMTLPKPKPRGITGAELDKYNKGQRLDRGRLKAFFLGFGYTADSDTDEIIESEADCILQLGIEIQKKGARQGQEQNVVQATLPVDEDGADEFTADAATDADDDEEGDF